MTLLENVSWIAIVIGILQLIIIAVDVYIHPQKMMPIMKIVWPLTGLFFPIIGSWAYYKLGKTKSGTDHKEADHHNHGDSNHAHENKPFWESVFVSTTHCSGGCALGDMIGAPIVFLTGFTIAGMTLFADYAVEFILAYLFGIAFQYYGMGFNVHESPGKSLKDAIKADTISLISFEIGMFGWMALVHYVLFVQTPEPDSPVFWFMMQIAMVIGFATSYPANWLLVKKGIKHAM